MTSHKDEENYENREIQSLNDRKYAFGMMYQILPKYVKKTSYCKNIFESIFDV